jgi:hypothetical protein
MWKLACLISALLVTTHTLGGDNDARAEGTEPFVILGTSVNKTIEFSYYLDVCGDHASGERLRALALRKVDTCSAPAAEKLAIRERINALTAAMGERVRTCDTDYDCSLGKRTYCPGIASQKVEFASLMDEAEKDKAALDRLAGSCN